jgi:hypothetical protein
MPYTLDELARNCNQALKDDPGPAGRQKMAEHLADALKDKDFVASQFPPENTTERKPIYTDPEFDFCILAHVYEGAKASNPHDHADSWAIYGQAQGVTEMTDWRKVKEPANGAPGQVEAERVYDMEPGTSKFYDVGVLHSPRREATTRLIRIEGKNLAGVTRDKYEVAPA